jgi:hypothetical protein
MIVDISKVKAVTLADITKLTGWKVELFADDVKESGIYRIMSGSRGILEEVELVGEVDATQLDVKDKFECIEFLLCDGYEYDEFDEVTEYVEDFYGVTVEEEYVQFGFTEEEFDWYFRIQL